MRLSLRQNSRKQRCKYLEFNLLLLPLLLILSACSTNNQISTNTKAITSDRAISFRDAESFGHASRTRTLNANSNTELTTALKTSASTLKSGINPERIIIPKIDVNAKVIDLGLNPDGTLEVPENYGKTGWWTGGAKPGEKGSAVIVGHLDSKTSPAVFYKLPSLKAGDLIKVTDTAGKIVNFKVERLKQVPKDNFPTNEVYTMTGEPSLRLVTCGGKFNRSSGHYLDNVIVFASLADS